MHVSSAHRQQQGVFVADYREVALFDHTDPQAPPSGVVPSEFDPNPITVRESKISGDSKSKESKSSPPAQELWPLTVEALQQRLKDFRRNTASLKDQFKIPDASWVCAEFVLHLFKILHDYLLLSIPVATLADVYVLLLFWSRHYERPTKLPRRCTYTCL